MFTRKLRELAAEEFSLTSSVHLIEKENLRSASLQRLLEFAVIRDLLYEVGRQAGSTASLNRVSEVEELCRVSFFRSYKYTCRTIPTRGKPSV